MRMLTLVLATCMTSAALAEVDLRTVRWDAAREGDPFGSGIIGVARVQADGVSAMVRCSSSPNRVEVRFFLDRAVVSGTAAVAWRFDTGERRTRAWTKSPNGHSLVVPRELQGSFVEQLRREDMLYLYVGDLNGAEQEVVVPLRGSSAAIGRALSWCDEARGS